MPNRPSAVTVHRKSHASRVSCEQKWCSHGARDACDLRGVATAAGRFDRIITVRNDVVESTGRDRQLL
eukprot:9179094-Lingulodinium_polyedra.AAC.1